MCIKGCWNNQYNNDYTIRMTKYKFTHYSLLMETIFTTGKGNMHE
jgi:hypothetical protein